MHTVLISIHRFYSFAFDRSIQRIKIKSSFSAFLEMLSNVPQSSMLESLFVKIYIYELFFGNS